MISNHEAGGRVPDDKIDLRGELCPINYVKTKLRLEDMKSGQVLEVLLDAGEPIQNVPRSLKNDGHQILGVKKVTGGAYRVLVRKG